MIPEMEKVNQIVTMMVSDLEVTKKWIVSLMHEKNDSAMTT